MDHFQFFLLDSLVQFHVLSSTYPGLTFNSSYWIPRLVNQISIINSPIELSILLIGFKVYSLSLSTVSTLIEYLFQFFLLDSEEFKPHAVIALGSISFNSSYWIHIFNLLSVSSSVIKNFQFFLLDSATRVSNAQAQATALSILLIGFPYSKSF